ncbi:MAG: hypothetical protein ACPKM0_06875 [Pleomorphochaeta sp.]
MKIVILFALISLFLYLGNKKPVWGFWIALSLFFNPAGLISYYMPNPIIGPLLLSDLMFFCMIFCFYKSKTNGKLWKSYDKQYKTFFYYLCFLLIYYYVVVLWLVPLYFERFDIHNFIKGRKFIWGILIGLMVYKEILWYGFQTLFKVVIWTTIIGISLFFISMLGYSIVPIIEVQRYAGESLLRYGMLSYGIMTMILYLVWTIILMNSDFIKKSKNSIYYYIAFALYILVGLLTLTRRTYLNFFLLPVLLYFLYSYIVKKTISLYKIIVPFFFIVIILGVFSPAFFITAERIVKDTFLLVFTGKDTRGEGNYRLEGEGDLLLTKKFIRESPILGQGYYYFNYGLKYDNTVSVKDMNFMNAQDAAFEVPIYSVFFQRGWLGFLLYIPVYIFIILILQKIIIILRKNIRYLARDIPLCVVFAISMVLFFVQVFSINAYNLFGTFTEPMFMIYCALLFATHRIIKDYVR